MHEVWLYNIKLRNRSRKYKGKSETKAHQSALFLYTIAQQFNMTAVIRIVKVNGLGLETEEIHRWDIVDGRRLSEPSLDIRLALDV